MYPDAVVPESLLSVMYWLHIAAGGLALASGTVAVLARKGRSVHRGAGKLFVVAMMTIAATAVCLAVVRTNRFLLFLGLFSAYLTASGRLALTRKKLPVDTPAPRTHWVLPSLMLAVVLGFSVSLLERFMPLLAGFMALSVLRSSTELRRMRRGWSDRNHWLIEHLFSMGTAFIASLTAFVVVNVGRLGAGPVVGYLSWIAPTAVGVPIIIRATRRYRSSAE